jgi:hypothetical protein
VFPGCIDRQNRLQIVLDPRPSIRVTALYHHRRRTTCDTCHRGRARVGIAHKQSFDGLKRSHCSYQTPDCTSYKRSFSHLKHAAKERRLFESGAIQ